VATVNALTVPIGAPLKFELTSASVMNVFFVPQLGSMIYTMNGMVTRLNLRADREGTFQGLSAQFSGDGFPEMGFDLHVVSPLAFPDWVKSTAQGDRVLNADSYAELARQSVVTDKPTYRLGDVRLFEKVATQKLPPGPGPTLVTESAQSYLGAAHAR
jgi:cytochrome o ubiquinol oxidase subunit 2